MNDDVASPTFAVFRLKRVKTIQSVRAMARQWYKKEQRKNADPHGVLPHTLHGSGDLVRDVNSALATINTTLRKDACVAIEAVMTASEALFRLPEEPPYHRNPERLQSWIEAATQNLHAQFPNQVVGAVLHLNEKTPHIQACIVPIVEKLRAPAGRSRDRTKRLSRGLDARTVMGGPAELSARQESYETALRPLGVQPRKKTLRAEDRPTHITIKNWYRDQIEMRVGTDQKENERMKHAQKAFDNGLLIGVAYEGGVSILIYSKQAQPNLVDALRAILDGHDDVWQLVHDLLGAAMNIKKTRNKESIEEMLNALQSAP